MKTSTIAALLSMMMSPAFADEACDVSKLEEQNQVLSEAMTKLATEDPARMQEFTTKLAEVQAAAQTSGDYTPLCALFDELLADGDQ